MYYEINVSLNGQHLFATAERSLTTWHSAKMAYELLRERFPASEGFGVTMTRWESVGTKLDLENQSE